MPGKAGGPLKGVSLGQWLWKNRMGAVGGFLLLINALVAIVAPWIAPADPSKIELRYRLAAPTFVQADSNGGILGKDSLGRDILSRIIHGSRVSLLVGAASVLVGGAIGVSLGLIAGYKGGKVDDILMRIADTQYAIPFLVLLIAILTIVGPGTLNVILFLGLGAWINFARIVRGEVLSIKKRDYVDAAVAVGAGDLRIMLRHVLPNAFAPVIVVATLSFGTMIIVESSLSFLGLGVPPDVPTWGRMLAESRDYITVAWWPAIFPGLAIMLVVLGANLTGDWLRDVLDPRLRGAR